MFYPECPDLKLLTSLVTSKIVLPVTSPELTMPTAAKVENKFFHDRNDCIREKLGCRVFHSKKPQQADLSKQDPHSSR